MGNFTELLIGDGVGDIHFNRFRIAFKPPAGISAATLAGDLVNNFPRYLNSAYANVEVGDHDHEGKPTFHFHGYAYALGFDLAKPHDDWVVREWVDRNIGFTAQTLKREFGVAGEDFGTGFGAGLGSLFVPGLPFLGLGGLGNAAVIGLSAVHYNRMHFLAGRRSWRIGEGSLFGVPGGVFVFETVAVERFSSAVYDTADAVLGLESKIPDVWIALLNNFVNMKVLTVVPQKLKPFWKNDDRVDYLTLSFDGFGALVAEPEFKDAYRLFPTILP